MAETVIDDGPASLAGTGRQPGEPWRRRRRRHPRGAGSGRAGPCGWAWRRGAGIDTAIGLYDRAGWTRAGRVSVRVGAGEPLDELVYLGPPP